VKENTGCEFPKYLEIWWSFLPPRTNFFKAQSDLTL